MAKALATNNAASAQDNRKKQRKKLAKREARLLLQLEQAQKAVQKAEQKLVKAQNRLEARKASEHAYEEQLRQMRSERPGSGAAIEQDHFSQDSADQQQAETSVAQDKVNEQKVKDSEGQAGAQPSAEAHDGSSSAEAAAPDRAEGEVSHVPAEDTTSGDAEANSASVEETPPVPVIEVSSLPPVEGRVDVSTNSVQTASDASPDNTESVEHRGDETTEPDSEE